MTLAYAGVSVLVRACHIQAVIYMQRFKSVYSKHPVKFLKNSVKIIHYIIAAVGNVTGIKTHSHFFIQLNPV